MSVVEVARRYGVVRQTVHGWLRDYAREGIVGLADKSSKPATCPHRMPAAVEARVVALRREHPAWGPQTILYELGREGVDRLPGRTSIYRALLRHGLIDPQRRRRRRSDYKRWERSRPMELWQKDITMGSIWWTGRRRRSSRDWTTTPGSVWKVASASRFHSVTRPASSIPTKASPAVSITARIRSSLVVLQVPDVGRLQNPLGVGQVGVPHRPGGVGADFVDGPMERLLHRTGLVGRHGHALEELEQRPFPAEESDGPPPLAQVPSQPGGRPGALEGPPRFGGEDLDGALREPVQPRPGRVPQHYDAPRNPPSPGRGMKAPEADGMSRTR